MKKAFNKLTYGMYLVNTKADKEAGCIINTFEQIASNPELVVIAINKENYTCTQIQKSKKFNVTVLKENANTRIINIFGFYSSQVNDKYKSFDKKYDILNLPYIEEEMVALFSVRVKEEMDAKTHIIFMGEVIESVLISDEKPMSYDYYISEKHGIVPPKASVYQDLEKTNGYKCNVCGYIYSGENLPIDYLCPICEQPHFSKISK